MGGFFPELCRSSNLNGGKRLPKKTPTGVRVLFQTLITVHNLQIPLSPKTMEKAGGEIGKKKCTKNQHVTR